MTGRIGSITYNTNTGSNTLSYPVVYKYNINNYLSRLEDASGNRLREINSVNALGQETNVLLGNGLTTTKNYTPEGLWTNVTTSNNVQNMSFNFNRVNGTLNSRTDNAHGLTESFTYDGLYRLKSFGSKTTDYDTNGNILAKSDVGGYTYTDSNKPYTLSSINTSSDLTNELNVSYTVMSRPTSISDHDGLTLSYTYNDNYDRAVSQYKNNANNVLYQTKYYFSGGKYEIVTDGVTESQRLYLDGSPYTASIVLEKIGAASSQSYFIHRDYLGSVTQISDNLGNLADEYSYDAWGRMRDVRNWDPFIADRMQYPIFGRGYTGHEHLNQFGLINMNARLYDPLLARFLAPDPFVGSGLTNDFNRYVYARNNPFMYTDPNGEWNIELGWNTSKGFVYRFSNGDSGFNGSYKNGTFVMGSTYNGYNQSVQFPSIQSYSTSSYHSVNQSTRSFQQLGINSGTLEGEGDDLTFETHYQLNGVVVKGQKQYKNSIGYPIFGELLSGKVDDRGYGPWNPDAIQIEGGVNVQLAGAANYSLGLGLITSGSHSGISVTTSGTIALNISNLLDFKNMSMLKIGPYFSFNMFSNHTNNSLSLDAYRKGGVTSTLGLGFGLTHGQAANTNTAFTSGPFAPALPYYDSYGITLNSGFGFSRAPSYTMIWEPFK